jgi:hypothetical protein
MNKLPQIGVAAIAKNEAPYILEWVAHYTILGFDKIIIADNESTDDTKHILDTLENMGLIDTISVKNGVCSTHYDFGTSPQGRFYNNIINTTKNSLDYLCLFDLDEFLFSETGYDPIHVINDIFASPDVSGIAVNWVVFGSNGHNEKSNDLVMSRFTHHSTTEFQVNQHFKSIVRLSECDSMFNPHYPTLNNGLFVNTLGQPIVTLQPDRFGLSPDVVWSRLRLHHYFSKSKEEFMLKINRGLADCISRRNMDDFYLHDVNECCMFDVQTHASNIKILIQEWGF